MNIPDPLFKNTLMAIEEALRGTSYFGEDDSVGTRVCCERASYEKHDSTCELYNVYMALRGLPS